MTFTGLPQPRALTPHLTHQIATSPPALLTGSLVPTSAPLALPDEQGMQPRLPAPIAPPSHATGLVNACYVTLVALWDSCDFMEQV